MAEVENGMLIIRDALLADTKRRRADPTDVLIKNGIILAVGHGLEAPAEAKVIDGSRYIIHPGLINAKKTKHAGRKKFWRTLRRRLWNGLRGHGWR